MSKKPYNPFLPLGKHALSLRKFGMITLPLVSFLFIMMSSVSVAAQAVGDYRSNAGSLNWTAASNWQRWNGSSWISNPSQGYPGQNAGTGTVTIPNGHTVVLNVSPAYSIASLVVGGGTSGAMILGNNNTNRFLTVSGNIFIHSGASLLTAGNGGNSIEVKGNVTNNGTLELNSGIATAELMFTGSANQLLNGSGITTDFSDIIINNTGTAGNNIVEIAPANFSAANGFLTLTDGIIKMSGTYTFSNTFFSTAAPTINADEGIWLNNPNVTVTGQNGNTQLAGMMRITSGIYNIGTATNCNLVFSSGAFITVEGGTLNVSGALYGSSSSTLTYTQSGGTVNVCTVGNSSAASFGIEATGSVFNMSGGTLVLQKPSTSTDDYINYAATYSVTGGTLQLGSPFSPAGVYYFLKSATPLYNLVVHSTNNPNIRMFNNTTFVNDVTIGGILDAATNNVNVTVQRNWINNGTFLPGTATVAFNSTTQGQTIGGSNNTTFYNLTNSNTTAAGLSLATNATVTNILSLASSSNGKFTIGENNLTIASGGSISGANSTRYIVTEPTTSTDGRLRQNNLAASARLFPIGTATNYLPATVTPNASGSDFSISVFRGTTTNGTPGGTAFGSRTNQVDAVWRIDRAAGAANAHIRLDWFANSMEGAKFTTLANSGIGIWRYTTTNWTLIPSPTVFINDNTANYASTSGSQVSNFGTAGTGYPYIVGDIVILPSALTMFTASSANSGNQLAWEIENADRYKSFELQESVDGRHFNYLYNVAATQSSRYTYFDAGISTQSKKYYQLKLTDHYGVVTYSQVVSVGGKKENKITLLQNPVQSELRFSHPDATDAFYTITDAQGKLMAKNTIARNAAITSINVTALAKGTYILQYANGNDVFTQLFVKQ